MAKAKIFETQRKGGSRGNDTFIEWTCAVSIQTAGLRSKPDEVSSLRFPVPLCFKGFVLFRLRHKLSGLNLPCEFYLHEDAVVAGLREAVGKRYFSRGSVVVHVFHGGFGAVTFGQVDRRHGDRACGMDVSKDVPVCA